MFSPTLNTGSTGFLQEIRFTIRRLWKAPAFTVVVLISLGVGMGATTAIYSVVKGVLLDPLPYDDPDQLVAVWNTAPGMGEDLLPQSFAVNAVYEDDARSLEHVGLWGGATSAVMGADGPEEVPAVVVTQGVFPALGVHPFLGREFTFEDTQIGSPLTVILAHSFWVSRFGADPDALGQTVTVTNIPREIIGVMPDGFRLMDRDAELYQPYRYTKAELTLTQFTYRSVARIRDGFTLAQARADLERLLPMAAERYPGGMTTERLEEIGGAPILHPLKDDLVGSVGDVLWVVLGGVGIILLVACANVANLLMVQSERQERALAIQSALGSSRRRSHPSVSQRERDVGNHGRCARDRIRLWRPARPAGRGAGQPPASSRNRSGRRGPTLRVSDVGARGRGPGAASAGTCVAHRFVRGAQRGKPGLEFGAIPERCSQHTCRDATRIGDGVVGRVRPHDPHVYVSRWRGPRVL